jgi:hypothetical protein
VVGLVVAGLLSGTIGPNDKFTVIKEAGCDLRVVSQFGYRDQNSRTRIIEHNIFNAGQGCVVQSDELDLKGPFTI